MLIWLLWPKFALFTEYVIWDFRTVVMHGGETHSFETPDLTTGKFALSC